jgi:hypothetical protein
MVEALGRGFHPLKLEAEALAVLPEVSFKCTYRFRHWLRL